MGEEKVKLNFQGHDVLAVRVPVNKSQENFNEYILDDGALLKLKVIVTEVLRIEGAYDQENNPLYVVKSTNVLAVRPPENLRRKP